MIELPDELPDKLSALIRVAVKDVETHVAKGGKIDMGTWINHENGVCYACLAGCVMLYSMNIPAPINCEGPSPRNLVVSGEIPQAVAIKLSDLNFIRAGFLPTHVFDMIMDIDAASTLQNDLRIRQWKNRAPVEVNIKRMLEVATLLEAQGL